MKTILVSGAIANKPWNGGAAWTRLSYFLGFRKLGFDVCFIEQIAPESCVDSSGAKAPFELSDNLAYFRHIVDQFDLSGTAALVCCDDQHVHGMTHQDLLDKAASADLLVNISGHLKLEPIKNRVPVRAYIDLDPGFTQVWNPPAAGLSGHDYYFTVGENIGEAGCSIPANGIRWRPTRQPVVIDRWPATPEGDETRFTTIASWRGPFGPVDCGGRSLGSKVREFRKYVGIPPMFDHTFELALDIHAGDRQDRELLSRNLWRLVDPRSVVPDPGAFRRYVQTSGAEFSVAQEIYVETGSGWFSDRSTRYLASGKPVLVEDTGFSRNYPVGDGLLAFSTPESAAEGVRRIARNYGAHARAARQIAQEYFDSDRVLGELIDQLGVCP